MKYKLFVSKAVDYVYEFARKNKTFMIEDVAEFAYSKGLPVPSCKSIWGTVATQAKEIGLIEHGGMVDYTSKGEGSHYANIWNSKVL